ncbi:MAG TPA: alpha/beta hydrolase [Ktedonobacterales bacterium]|nr:alpha/beta hydrolase [Ktedonobacterales bacterium]
MSSGKRLFLKSQNARLCCIDFGGDGPTMLLLHGLAGRANEWHSTAEWLSGQGHVFALDQRGHGKSEKGLADYSRDAYVNDVITVIQQLRLAPVVLIGQSMGGQNAFLVASRRPDLVRALIVVEARPGADPATPAMVERWLDSWPVPFPSLADARIFFGGDTLYAQTWLEMLEEREDGYWPQFRKEEMLRSIEDQARQDYWAEWERITCPTLIVGGERSFLPQEQLQEMARRIPQGRYVQVEQADHDLHLDRPERWREIVGDFLRDGQGRGVSL